MLTSRGWWLLLTALAVLGLGGLMPPEGHPALTLVGLTMTTVTFAAYSPGTGASGLT